MASTLSIDYRIDRIAQHIVRARIYYDLWIYFEGSETRPAILDTMTIYNEFFRFDLHAHFLAFIVYIAGVFENRPDTINFPELMREIERDNLILEEDLSALRLLSNNAKELISKVMILRSNALAHRSSSLSYDESFKKAAVTPNQLLELTEIALKLANRMLRARHLQEQFFRELPRAAAEKMLKALAEYDKDRSHQ